jgi:DNA-binding NarL/FixJ family response regulator
MPDGTAAVLLVDDHAVIAAAMVVALTGQGFDPVVAADADDLSTESVLRTARQLNPDVVLLDVHLGAGRLGVPMVRPLVEGGAKVLLFTASTEARLIVEGLRAGAEAVLDKAMSFDKVVATLHDVMAGRQLMPREEREALIEALDQDFAAETERRRPFEALTEREAQVLRSLIDGRSPKLLAKNEGISVSTVRGHIERIFQKLGVSSQREALARARAAGWPGDDGP